MPDISLKKVMGFIFLILLFLCVFLLMYMDRVYIYRPLEITITSKYVSDSTNYSVNAIRIMNGKYFLTPTKKEPNRFIINSEFLNSIIIEGSAKNPNSIHNINEVKITFLDDGTQLNFKPEIVENKIVIKEICARKFIDIFILLCKKTSLLNIIVFILACFMAMVVFLRYHKLMILNSVMVVFIICWGLFWLILASFYTYPNAEDLSLVYRPIYTIFTVPIDFRYTTNFLTSVSPFAFGGVEFYKFNSLISIVLIIVASYYFFTSFLPKNIKRVQIWLLTFIFVIIHFTIIPSIAHSLYWTGTCFEYLYSWILILLWISFYYRYLNTHSVRLQRLYYWLGIVTLFFSYGCVEVNIFLNSFLLFAFAVYIYKQGKRNFNSFWPLLILSAFCITLLFLNKGNLGKINELNRTNESNFEIDGLIISTRVYLLHIAKWTLILLPFTLFISKIIFPYRDSLKSLITSKSSILIIAGFLITFHLIIFLYVLTLDDWQYLPSRMLNYINWGHQLIMCLLLPLLIIKSNAVKWEKYAVHLDVILSFSLFIFIGYYIFFVPNNTLPNNIKLIEKEYFDGTLTAYKQECKHIYSVLTDIRKNDNRKPALIPELNTTPKSVLTGPQLCQKYSDTTGYKWVRIYEKYFKVNEVIVYKDTLNDNK